ncbi:MAG: hypothetical protein UT08_C0009G0018 [Candidatus Woesebacteria bacterium GW2011_GWB1_38_8]|uniref:Uncharacterized protein n=1 Tax=Candidatus Woesebacteria bacterium GW2011_GWB1_38_8 TaxID=1618570 RepID=A0A0G0NH25_9BACT|nr:MAG: hypothetical protein UT08_C0009G0018 [Candidatus Woesebacteria bacterium GW2011_GWB1_38_8]
MLSRQAIDEYKAIYKKEYGKDITDAEAEEQGMKLLRLFKIIYRPIPKGWPKEYGKKLKEASK